LSTARNDDFVFNWSLEKLEHKMGQQLLFYTGFDGINLCARYVRISPTTYPGLLENLEQLPEEHWVLCPVYDGYSSWIGSIHGEIQICMGGTVGMRNTKMETLDEAITRELHEEFRIESTNLEKYNQTFHSNVSDISFIDYNKWKVFLDDYKKNFYELGKSLRKNKNNKVSCIISGSFDECINFFKTNPYDIECFDKNSCKDVRNENIMGLCIIPVKIAKEALKIIETQHGFKSVWVDILESKIIKDALVSDNSLNNLLKL
jgi:hypothetical protein